MEHLDEDTVLRLAQGELAAEDLARADAHMAVCDDCRGLVADVARSLRDSSDGAPTVSERVRPRPSAGAGHVARLAQGTAVGRYVVGEVLGAGGMGVVYLARDPALNRRVTLKLLREDERGHTLAPLHLLREAQAMAQLSHPNVVAIYDVGTFEGQVFIAMEFVEGDTLGEWLAEEKRTWREIVEVFIQAGRGLEAAHAVGIVHRDFKPANVLVGRDGRVRVADFGLARSLEGEVFAPDDTAKIDSKLANLTATGMIKGTPAYMAPEQVLSEPVTPKTDQFSFCAALFEPLYGQRAFRPGTPEKLDAAVLDEAIERSESGEIPPVLLELLRRGLSRRPEDRHASIGELLQALEAVRAPSSEEPGPARRRPALVAAGALAALCLAAAAWWVTGAPAPGPEGAAIRSAAERARSREGAATALDRASEGAAAAVERAPSTQGASQSAAAAVERALATEAPAAAPGPTPSTSAPRAARPKAPLVERSRRKVRRASARPKPAAPAKPAASRPYDDSPMEPAFVRDPP